MKDMVGRVFKGVAKALWGVLRFLAMYLFVAYLYLFASLLVALGIAFFYEHIWGRFPIALRHLILVFLVFWLYRFIFNLGWEHGWHAGWLAGKEGRPRYPLPRYR